MGHDAHTALRLDENTPLFAEYVEIMGGGDDIPLEAVLGDIGPDDALLIIDMQADFVPADPLSNPSGGRFGVAEGSSIVSSIVQLARAFSHAGGTVVATRDYHPVDHCSFAPVGPFPCHCVQGSEGAKFLPPIAAVLAEGLRQCGREKVLVAFKGMHEHIDSFGALPYFRGGDGRIKRLGTLAAGSKAPAGPMGCAAAPWTGSLVLKTSNMQDPATGAIDMDAPPDMLATREDGVERGMRSLQDALRGKKRLFVCGLALDFCVMDTCLNAKDAGFDSVHMVLDAARAAHVPGIGQYGSGFLSDPKAVLAKLTEAKVKLVSTGALVGPPRSHWGKVASVTALSVRHRGHQSQHFPNALPPLGLLPARLSVQLDEENSTYEIELAGPLALLERHKIETRGSITPAPVPLPKRWPGAPPSASHLCWANPIRGVHALTSEDQLTFLSLSTSAELCFAAYGGFLLLSASGAVVAVQAIGPGETLKFGPPRPFPSALVAGLQSSGRLQPVTLPELQRAGALSFGWLNPGKLATSDDLRIGETGGFVYLRDNNEPPLHFDLLPRPAEHVAFITDVEGNWEYLIAFVEQCEGLELLGVLDDGSADLALADGWQLVFGGDSVDKGGETGGSVRVVKTLVRTKRKYGGRVTLLLGNRDCNKMRFTSELCAAELAGSRLHAVPGPYWVPEAKRVAPVHYLRNMVAKTQGKPEETVTEAELQEANAQPLHRLRWMLIETMGAAGEEERRRQELAHIAGGRMVDDAEVFASFVDSVEPGGWMRELLELGELAKIIDGTLFVHGGVMAPAGSPFRGGAEDVVGLVPGRADRISDVSEWVRELNSWKQAQVEAWKARPTWDPAQGDQMYDAGARGGHALMDYAVSFKGSEPSVIQCRHLKNSGMPAPMPEELCTRLHMGGIYRMVVGHTPHGSCPTVIRNGTAERPVLVVMADTSYSDMSRPDNRGDAVSTVVILNDGSVTVDGALQDGTKIGYTLKPDASACQHELIGQCEPDGTEEQKFVKARLVPSGDYLLAHHAGFKINYFSLPEPAARDLLKIPPAPPPPLRLMSSGLTSMGDEVACGCSDEFESARRELLSQFFLVVDQNNDGELTVDELGTALAADPTLLKVLGGTGSDASNVSAALAAMRHDPAVATRVQRGEGVTLADFQRIFQEGIPASPGRSASTMSMQRAGRLTRTFSRLSPHTVEAATPSAASRRSSAPAELWQPARPSSAEASAPPHVLGWVADAPRARGLLVIAAFATVAFAASRLRS